MLHPRACGAVPSNLIRQWLFIGSSPRRRGQLWRAPALPHGNWRMPVTFGRGLFCRELLVAASPASVAVAVARGRLAEKLEERIGTGTRLDSSLVFTVPAFSDLEGSMPSPAVSWRRSVGVTWRCRRPWGADLRERRSMPGRTGVFPLLRGALQPIENRGVAALPPAPFHVPSYTSVPLIPFSCQCWAFSGPPDRYSRPSSMRAGRQGCPASTWCGWRTSEAGHPRTLSTRGHCTGTWFCWASPCLALGQCLLSGCVAVAPAGEEVLDRAFQLRHPLTVVGGFAVHFVELPVHLVEPLVHFVQAVRGGWRWMKRCSLLDVASGLPVVAVVGGPVWLPHCDGERRSALEVNSPAGRHLKAHARSPVGMRDGEVSAADHVHSD